MPTEISDPTGRSNEKDSRGVEQWALAAVLILAATLRLFRLEQLPNGFSPDEASYGYNGYSLLHTGRDRFGEWLPLFADNFGDLIAASYMWLTVPSIALFGLDEFAVRLPAALIGIATVWVAYKLGTAFYDAWAGLLSALFLAISPWHIQVSRYAERSPLLPLLFCLGLFLFLRWQQKQKKELLWSALAFALCLYSYASARVFVPLYVLGAALIYSSSLWAERRRALMAISLFVLLALPAVYCHSWGRASLRPDFALAASQDDYRARRARRSRRIYLPRIEPASYSEGISTPISLATSLIACQVGSGKSIPSSTRRA